MVEPDHLQQLLHPQLASEDYGGDVVGRGAFPFNLFISLLFISLANPSNLLRMSSTFIYYHPVNAVSKTITSVAYISCSYPISRAAGRPGGGRGRGGVQCGEGGGNGGGGAQGAPYFRFVILLLCVCI